MAINNATMTIGFNPPLLGAALDTSDPCPLDLVSSKLPYSLLINKYMSTTAHTILAIINTVAVPITSDFIFSRASVECPISSNIPSAFLPKRKK